MPAAKKTVTPKTAPRARKSAPASAAIARDLGSIAGQESAVRQLRAWLSGGRLANAYLFHGPWGVGKCTAALALASALLCPNREAAGGDACGRCPGCHKSLRLMHPDLRFVFPVSGEESALEETIAETLDALRTDPFHVFAYEKAASIRIGMTRDLLRELSFRPYEADRRVIVIRDADRMREDQYSAMLKSLEEPGGRTVWILTTSRAERLPATIRSRCLRLRFLPLADEIVAGFLAERAGIPESRAALLAAVSAGSLGRALVWRHEDVDTARDAAVAMLRPALAGDAGRTLAEASKVARGWNRETLRRTLEFQMLWLRDVLRVRYGAPESSLANRDRISELRSQAERVTAREIHRRLAALEEIGRAIEGNVNPESAFFAGLARIGGLVPDAADDWPAYAGRRA